MGDRRDGGGVGDDWKDSSRAIERERDRMTVKARQKLGLGLLL